MVVRKFKIVQDDSTVVQEPFIRFSTHGCSIPSCGCSPERYLSFSNGKEGIVVELTPKEAKEIQKAFAEGFVDFRGGKMA